MVGRRRPSFTWFENFIVIRELLIYIYIYITFIIKPSRMEIIIMVFIWLAVIFRNDKLIQPVEPFYFQKKKKKLY